MRHASFASAPLAGPTAAILIVGDEILSAKVEDENARFLLRELRGMGILVRRVEIIPDDLDQIAAAVRTMAAQNQHVFTSGGVGPTHDDLTMAGVAQAFGMPIARRDSLVPLIQHGLGRDFSDRDLRMADIPAGATLEFGMAPQSGTWPVVCVKNVFVLPGVPAIFRRKFELLRPLLQTTPLFSRALFLREPEGLIAAALDEVVARFGDVAIGSYPALVDSDHKVKVTLDGRQGARVEAAVAELVRLLGPAVVRTD